MIFYVYACLCYLLWFRAVCFGPSMLLLFQAPFAFLGIWRQFWTKGGHSTGALASGQLNRSLVLMQWQHSWDCKGRWWNNPCTTSSIVIASKGNTSHFLGIMAWVWRCILHWLKVFWLGDIAMECLLTAEQLWWPVKPVWPSRRGRSPQPMHFDQLPRLMDVLCHSWHWHGYCLINTSVPPSLGLHGRPRLRTMLAPLRVCHASLLAPCRRLRKPLPKPALQQTSLMISLLQWLRRSYLLPDGPDMLEKAAQTSEIIRRVLNRGSWTLSIEHFVLMFCLSSACNDCNHESLFGWHPHCWKPSEHWHFRTRICTGFEVIKVEWSKRPELRTTLKAGAKSLVSEAGTWSSVDKAFESSLKIGTCNESWRRWQGLANCSRA